MQKKLNNSVIALALKILLRALKPFLKKENLALQETKSAEIFHKPVNTAYFTPRILPIFMTIKIINRSEHPLPAYETALSAGMDLRANLEETIMLQPLERVLVPTGLYIGLEKGTEAQIRPRSGLAFKYGVTVLNTPGTIDADYRGEIKVLLINLSQEVFAVNNGDRIAQMIIAKHEQPTIELVGELSETARGEGGFGSTGKH